MGKLNFTNFEQPEIPHAPVRKFGTGKERGDFEMVELDKFLASHPDPEESVVLVNKEDPNNWSMASWAAFYPYNPTSNGSPDRVIYDPEKHFIYRRKEKEERS